MTFAAYRGRCERVAAGLRALGIDAGSHVSWQLPTSLDALVVFGALARLDAVQNPIVPTYRDRELDHVVRQTGATLLIVPGTWRGHDYAAMAARVTTKIVSGPMVLVADAGLPEGDPTGLPEPPRAPAVADRSAARWTYYTSGSTSEPKGVLHSDATLATVAAVLVERLAMTSDDRIGMVFPFAHVGGSNFLLSALMVGATCICIDQFDPCTSIDILAREGVTLAGAGTVFHLAYLDAQRSRPGAPIFSHVRAFPGGGSPKPPQLHYDLKAEIGGAGIVSALGLTECQLVGMGAIGDPDDKLAQTEGAPSPGAEVRVRREDGTYAPAGEPGELVLVAPQMFLGYVDRELERDAFDQQGYFRTGDLGFVDADGYVHVLGRLKDVINRKGENISAKEIEDVLYGHPRVAEVAVIGLPDPTSGERCCAVIVRKDPSIPLPLEEIQQFLRDRGLMPQKFPEQLELVPELPKAPAGKVIKQALRVRFSSPPEERR